MPKLQKSTNEITQVLNNKHKDSRRMPPERQKQNNNKSSPLSSTMPAFVHPEPQSSLSLQQANPQES